MPGARVRPEPHAPADGVEAEHEGEKPKAGEHAEPPLARAKIAHRVREDDPDGGLRRLQTEAEEGQSGLVQDRMREEEDEADEELRHEMRKDVVARDVALWFAKGARRLDIAG
jgi:hypothetical protein